MTDAHTAQENLPEPAALPQPEALGTCVRLATTAPSLHNSQPWLFRVGDGMVDVYADWHRQLEVLDPTGRELLISIGAAVFTLGLALRGVGYRPEIGLFPDAGKPDLVARVSIGQRLPLRPAVRSRTGTPTGTRSLPPLSPPTRSSI